MVGDQLILDGSRIFKHIVNHFHIQFDTSRPKMEELDLES